MEMELLDEVKLKSQPDENQWRNGCFGQSQSTKNQLETQMIDREERWCCSIKKKTS